jgi:DNA-binding NarL/FixJ family response regulator
MNEIQSVKILVVEDNPEISNNLRQALELKKYEVTVANTGTKALEIIQGDNTFNLVILDVMLPGASGWEILIKLKSKPVTASWPVIMLTAIDDEASEANALYDGADDYITKPYRIKTLLARVEALIRRSSMHTYSLTPEKSNIDLLSEREKEVLACLTEGMSNNQISEKLMISRLTVEGHVKKILEKLHVENRTQAAIMGIKCNLV